MDGIQDAEDLQLEREKREEDCVLFDPDILYWVKSAAFPRNGFLPHPLSITSILGQAIASLERTRNTTQALNTKPGDKKEMIKNIGIELNIIPKPKEPEAAEISKAKDVAREEKDPWWKLW